MNCYCDHCEGTGKVRCDECDGRGEWESSIATAKLDSSIAGFEELYDLQQDAKRVQHQAARLKELRPQRSCSYDAQLESVMSELERQADNVAASAAKKEKHRWGFRR